MRRRPILDAAVSTVARVQPAVPVFLFDGDCGFCRKWTRWLQRRLPAGTRFLPYQEVDDLTAYGLTASDLTTASYWITAAGVPHRGAQSFAQALQTARWPWSALGTALSTPPISALADRLYPVIARNRHRLPAPDRADP
jgi:predicted DCC family thiol-disulfide oxidoreductase YuxK